MSYKIKFVYKDERGLRAVVAQRSKKLSRTFTVPIQVFDNLEEHEQYGGCITINTHDVPHVKFVDAWKISKANFDYLNNNKKNV